ncbi:MAG: anti-sigma factor family protein [Bryobacteraceae bacterium]
MTCSEIAALSPLYLSGELDTPRAAGFAAHLETCPACATEIEREIETDRRLREVFLAAETNTGELDRRIRARLRSHRTAWTIGGIAAAIALLIGGFAYRDVFAPPLPIYADAAADHRLEVVERQPRLWRSQANDIDALAAREGIAPPVEELLAPAGYRLDRARLCRIAGRVFLHLVYSNGDREISLFLRQRDDASGIAGTHSADSGAEHMASFATSRVTAILVTEQSGASAQYLARFAAMAL